MTVALNCMIHIVYYLYFICRSFFFLLTQTLVFYYFYPMFFFIMFIVWQISLQPRSAKSYTPFPCTKGQLQDEHRGRGRINLAHRNADTPSCSYLVPVLVYVLRYRGLCGNSVIIVISSRRPRPCKNVHAMIKKKKNK